VGRGAWISPSASICNKLSVGAGVFVGMAAVVTRDVADGETVVGSPARPLEKHRRLLEHWASVAEG
jgi:acetyltransferase-like isoleucine patch superfamily enzyme